MNLRSKSGFWILLVSFLFTRGLVPVGTMPNAIGSGSPLALCPGDSQSAAILELVADKHAHHHHHHHTQGETSYAAENTCKFSAVGAVAGAGAWQTPQNIPPVSPPATDWHFRNPRSPVAYQRPFLRGPPISIPA